MRNLSHDIKFGFRQLLKRPLITIAISLSLALGIGANSAVFSIVDAILSIASAQLIASMMFGNSGTDFSVYVALPLMLIAVSMLACFIPAYWATKVEPTDALRHE